MYAVVIFALALLSPLPFISPFASVDAAEGLTYGAPDITKVYYNPKDSVSFAQTTAATDGDVILTASQFTPDTILIKATVNGRPSFSLVAESDQVPFNFPNNIFTVTGTYKNNSAITNANSTSWFAHEHVAISYIDNDTANGPNVVDPLQFIPAYGRSLDLGARLGDSISNLGDIDGDGISDIGIGATGEGDLIHTIINGSNLVDYEFTRRDRGAFYIMLMNDDGTIKSSIKFDHTTPNMPSLINDPRLLFDVSLGSSIATLGDVYNDGTTVLAVGAAQKSNPRIVTVGMVLILHLSSDGTRILDSFVISADTIYPEGVFPKIGTAFGSSLVNIGDVDNNGVPDLAIGASGYPDATDLENITPVRLGAVFIFHMGENATSILNVANITSLTNGLDLESVDKFGASVELLETYDDGTIALAVGAPEKGLGFDDKFGYIYILNMTNNATTVSTVNIINETSPNLILNQRNYNLDGNTGTTAKNAGTFGTSLENMGDLNGDGVNDLLVGYPNLNSIGGSYILYMNSDNTIQHSVRFQIDRHETELGTAKIIANGTADDLETFRKYFNYSTLNMPEYLFQEHIHPQTNETSDRFFNLGTAVVNFGDVHNDGYDDIGMTSIGLNSGTVVVLNRLGPTVNITVDPNYTNINTIHYRPDATNYITVNGIDLTKDLDISIKPYMVDVEPITINSLSIASSSGTNFANAGKIITVTLATDGSDLGNITGTLLGRSLSSIITGGSVEFTATVQSNDTNENAAFSFSATNSTGNIISLTNADITDGSFVTIDTIKPVIVLTDGADSVLQGDAYLEPGTAISDSGNASYAGLVSATSLNTTILGPQNITYTGTVDVAGNEPDSINRTITVLAKPLGLNSLTIESNNNVNTSFAKDGDVITVTLVANGTIGNVTGVIVGNSVTYTATGDSASATVTVNGTFTDTASVTFSINASNADNLAYKIFTDTNLTGSNIAIDITAPSITLNGANNTLVFTNSTYVDKNATASDASYATGSVQVSGAGTVNTAIADNYTLTYTAPVDPAGNTGSTITRNVIVQDAPPIGITAFTITSANSNKSYAKVGDDLILLLTVNYTITTHTTQILNTDPDSFFVDNGNSLITSLIIPNNAIESNATFTITVTNINGTTLTVTEDDLTSSNVFVDTIPPNITLIGPADSGIVLNSTYTDPGANARDGDPNYSGTYTTTINGTFGTAILGAIYEYTYTANDDSAGNPGSSTTRIVRIVDADPISITSLSIASNSGNNFANAGKIITLTLATDGSDLGNITGTLLGRALVNDTNGGSVEFTATVVSGDDGNAAFSITVTNSSGNQISVTNADITDGSFVTIDTIKPVIVLTDGADSVLQGDAYPEPGTAISDSGNASYAGLVSATSLNTLILGPQNITYTGTADAAGNEPDQQTRTVTVLAKPLGLNSLTIESNNNVNTSFAKDGDVITVTLAVNGTIGNVTGVIAGNSATYTVTGNNASATVTVDGAFTDTASVTFSITVYNEDNSTFRTFTNTDLTGSNIAIDTTAPSITLNGVNNTIVIMNQPYEDPNATASDTSYATGSVQVSGAGNVNTAIVGNYTLTYTAPDDYAGNTGPVITRTVTVQDAPPINVNSLSIASNSGNNYANAGKTVTVTLVTDGTNLNSLTGVLLDRSFTNTTTGGSATFAGTVQSGDDGNATFSITVTNSSGSQISITNANITDGSYVTIDTIKPVINLTGGNDSVLQGETYQDPGTTVSDINNASYAGPVSASSIDTSTLGAKTITYTGTADAAGNEPNQITRIVTVFAKPLGINSLTIESNNNVNTSFAKDGDVIIVTLVANGTIGNATGVIAGVIASNSVTYAVTNNTVLATVTVDGTFADTASVTFSITAFNEDNFTFRTFTNVNLTGSNIAIDTTAPSITLNGANNTFVVTNSSYTDLGATATDISYATGSVQVSGAGNVDTTTNAIYTLTYTAPDDPAGNIGPVITRTVTVHDAPPINVNSLSIASNSGNNYANESKTVTVTLVTDGTNLNSLTGVLLGRSFTNTTTGGSATFTGTVQSGDDGNATFSITATNSSGSQISITNADITDGSYVTIDTIKPVINLTGGNDFVLQGETYQDPGTTVSDINNASYAGPVSASSIDTSTLGAKTITYTGTADAAGNEPNQITRIVTVLAKPLGINSLTIESNNNVNTSFAKDGDVITVTLAVNGTIGNVTGVIAGNSATYNVTGNNASATVTVDGAFTDTASVTFSITAYNEDNSTFRTFTNTDLTGSNIAIDTTAPSITLNGANNTRVVTNSSYTDPGAIATDASYATGSVQVPGAGTVNIATAGNYTITYTAPVDPAGNPGNTISRTVRVQDASPLEIVSKFIHSPSGTLTKGTDFSANIITRNINLFETSDKTYALLTRGSTGAWIIADVTNPALPSIVYTNTSFAFAYKTSIFTIDNTPYAIAAGGTNPTRIIDISSPASPSVIATLVNGTDYPRLYNAQGVTTVTIGASTFALVASSNPTNGVQIINVTNPNSPSPVSSFTDDVDGYLELELASDITTVTIGASVYALATGYFDDGVQIINITDPYSPLPASSVTDGRDGYDTLRGPVSITTVTVGSSVYALVASLYYDGVQIINITDPYNPLPASSVTDGIGGYDTLRDPISITTVTVGSSVYALAASVLDNGIQIIDITDPYNPKPASSIVDNTGGYTNLESPRAVITATINGTTYAFIASNAEGLQIIKLESPPLVSITSNNTNPAYAKTGDTLTVQFTVNDTISSHTSQILGLTPNVTLNGANYSATLTVPSVQTESYATFAAEVVNNDGATLSVTENDVPLASNVFIDTIGPRISLIGTSSFTVILNSTDPFIPGAIITDGDPNYLDTFTITINGTLDTSVINSTVTYTYTAATDGAGNAGSSVTRTVTVVEAEPITINSLTIASSSGTNYANAGKTITVTLATDGSDLGNFTGTLLGRSFTNTTNGGSAEFTATVVSGDDGDATFSITATNSSGNKITLTNSDITDSSSVTIDTIKPVIVLTGGAVSVLQGDAYLEPGTAISDSGNASYAGLVSATSINTLILGPQNITYTGTVDVAGNVPDQQTRTVTVLAKPLGINSLTIESNNNVNTSFAKDGDVITVTLVANGTIGNATGVIASNSVTYAVTNNTVLATVTVDGTFADTASVTFSITAFNEDNSTFRTFTNANLTGSNIAIDTTAPNITLNGANNTIVIRNQPYEDPNATASDVSYATGSVQVSGAGNLDITTNAIYTLTYTAPDDPAGNIGPVITRTVTVQDAPPINVNSLSIASDSGNNYANAGKIITLTLDTDGSDLGNITGTLLGRALVNDTNGGSVEFTATVVSGDDGNAAFSITVTNSSGNKITLTNSDITDSSSVTIDTIKPVIVLTGGAVSVLQGDAYLEPGTAISDSGNASYAGLVSATSINTLILGPQNITYTGTVDVAGNVPDQQTRTVTVLAKPLGLNSLTIESNNNVNTSFAKDGDVITVTLAANGTIGNVTGVIAGNSVTYTATGDSASTTVTVDGTFTDTASVTFSINVSNADNLAYKIFTDANLTGSNIAIDTTAPNITLNGANNTIVIRNQPYEDPNATASDVSYATGSVQVSGAGNLDITTNAIYTLTYTAPDDPAGNIGPVITRTVTVQDAPPINVNSLSIASDSGNNYANAGKTVTVTLVTDGTNLNSLTGILLGRSFTNTTTGGSATFTGTVQSGDDGDATFSITATNSSGNKITLTNSDITDSSSVTIDTIKPVIVLTGGAVSVLHGDAYLEPGTAISDSGNASYAGLVSATSINTLILGPQNITYTGTVDVAGNVPDQQTRTVTVLAKPLGLNSLTIESNNNVNTSFAKDGDVITVTLVANGTIGNVTGVIAGNSVTYTATGDSASTTVTVDGTFTDTASVTFSINVSNADNLAYKIFTDANLTGSNIAIDTTAPSITLNGANNTIVIRNQPYEDPNATAYDTSYPTGSVQVSGAGNLDITTNAIYTLTYTAPDDPAGNIGPVITRTVTVQDAPPINVNSLSIASDSGNNYANAGKTVTVTLVTDGTNLNSLTGILLGRSFTNTTTGGSATFTGTVQSGDDGDATFSITATNSSGNKITLTNSDITDSSSVTIDTIKPVIVLTGGAVSVLQGDAYLEPGTAISDSGNASYAGLVSATSINTLILGPQNITYTGTVDVAGNVPDQQTRTVTVLAKPLGLNSLTIESNNNVNTSFAKDGDVITVTLVANGTIGNVTGVIAGNSVTYTATGDSALATVTVNGTFTDTASVTFSINASNADNLAYKIFTDANLNGSNIAIDTTAPNITLNGANNTIVIRNQPYEDPNATASDVSYATGSVQVSGAGNLDITTNAIYTLTYTAPDDPAGNIGPVITRTVTVQDAPPINVNSLSIASDSGNNYANAGKTVTVTLVTDGTNLNSLTGILLGRSFTNTTTGGSATFTGTVQSGDDGDATFSITATNSSGNKITLTNSDITDSSSVTIDTIKPVIVLTGGAVSVLQGDAYLEPGTAISDSGNASYAGLVSATSINTLILGPQNITYTGTVDVAGNVPDQQTRTVTVLAKPLGLNSLTIESNNNVNTSFAKDGDVITVTLVANGTIGNVTGVIAGNSVTYTATGDSALATVTVNGTFTDTASVTFSINASNADNLAYKIFTDANLNGSNIAIDTTAPSITLNGTNNTIVIRNQPYEDPNATAYDTSYPTGSVQVSGAGTVDTAIAGNYTLTYTAPDDPAGNTGSTITRNVIVQDTPPIDITAFTITTANTNKSYAKAGDRLTLELTVNYTITSFTAQILNTDPDDQFIDSSDDRLLVAYLDTPNNAIEENATFIITVTNINGTTLTVTQDNLTGSNIFVDTIPPTIILGQPKFITIGEQPPAITGTVTDGDPNYDSTTLTCDLAHVNTAIANVYPVTCTANDDNAGNPGSNTTYIDVRNVNGTTILNSSYIDSNAPIVQNINGVIMALIHNDSLTNPDNRLKLRASTLELNTSAVTSSSTDTHTTTYPHPLDLIVNSKITAKIERNTTMTFNTNNSNPGNFTISEIIDNHNDGAIRFGFDNISYTLTGNALELTFSEIRSSFDAFVRNGTFDSYVKIIRYNDTIDDASSALTVINGNPSFSGVLYTYNSTERIVTIWTSHLSDFKVNTTSSGGSDSDSDSNAPTLGKTSSGAQLVTNGFEYNGLTINVGRYHTEFPLIGTNVGDINTIKMKIYDSAGPEGIKRVEVALGVPDVGLYHEAEAFVEVWMQKDSIAVKEIVIVDKLNLLEDSDVSSTVSQISCTGDVQQCLLVELKYSYREPPIYNTVSIKPVDWDNNAHQFYFNDGIHVDGNSINLPKEIDISTSHATGISNTVETLHLVQIDRAEHLWVDQYGYQWMIIGNTVRQITTPEYVVPDDNTYGTLHGPDRNHPDFASTVYAEQKRAQETLAGILGHATIIKPLPENGGTIYFDATGTDSRKGDSFKLVLELETARMQQLSNLLYDDTK